VLVKLGAAVVEVATFRTDGSYSDRRRPDSVAFSTAREDAARRDFTVNALFLDPFDTSPDSPRGRVVDFVGGLADLTSGVLRAVGDPERRLAEDHLRALRAARLAAKLGFEIEPGTAAAIRRHASDLEGVSRERIGDEVRNMLSHPSRPAAAGWVDKLGLTTAVVGGSASGSARPFVFLKAIPPDAGLGLALAAWALDLDGGCERHAEATAARWRDRLCLSNAEHAELRATLTHLARLSSDWSAMSVAAQKRLAARGAFENAVALLEARDAGAGSAVRARVAELAASPGGIAPMPLVTGDELVARGLSPGPAFKRILDGLYDAQLEGRIRTIDEAWELAKGLGAG
jgi:tRNA nucleotidyltransferase/poly(A) polymerase